VGSCSPDERSENPGRCESDPGFRFAHPGYEASRHCERSEAIHLSVHAVTMDCFAALAMTRIQFRDLAAHAPEVCIFGCRPLVQRAQGRPGACCTRGLACDLRKTKVHTSIQGSGSIPAFPAQWLYGLLRALPGERLSCHRRLQSQPQAWRQHRGVRTTRLRRTQQPRTSVMALVSIASHRTFVTIASAPHLP
jgi:hypothetical protein